ncbi:MAG: hypothetical protein ACK59M_11015 [Pseudomonadota bacterium]
MPRASRDRLTTVPHIAAHTIAANTRRRVPWIAAQACSTNRVTIASACMTASASMGLESEREIVIDALFFRKAKITPLICHRISGRDQGKRQRKGRSHLL